MKPKLLSNVSPSPRFPGHSAWCLAFVCALLLSSFSGQAAGKPFYAAFSSTYTNPGLADDGGLLTVVSGAGQAEHLGLVTIQGVHEFEPDLSVRNGSFTITASNGDFLTGEYSGQLAPISDIEAL